MGIPEVTDELSYSLRKCPGDRYMVLLGVEETIYMYWVFCFVFSSWFGITIIELISQ
jgi:hypothetical protein